VAWIPLEDLIEVRARFKKTKVIVQTYIKQVDKTSKFDVDGMPAYIIRTEANILTEANVSTPEKKS
jgi:hypothetical protein